MTNHADRFGFMQAGKPPVSIPTKTHILVGSSYATYVAAFVYWQDFIFDSTWTPIGILLSGFAIIAALKAFFHLWTGILQYFGKKYPKTFYISAMVAFAALMYVEWITDSSYFLENGKHGPYFFLIMGMLVVMEYVLFKEWLKTATEEENRNS